MGSHIIPTGWNNWGKETNEATARFSEWRSRQPDTIGADGKVTKGVPLDLSTRFKWAKVLTDGEAAKYTIANIFGEWNPALNQ